LNGLSPDLDPLYHAYRNDLADIALADRLFAPHYAKPVTRHCGSETALLKHQPSESSETMGELLPQEGFALLDITAGWAWGYRLSDHLVGYVREESLAPA
jgi:hypothetical protein